MSFVFSLIELILVTFISIDTLGFAIRNRKNSESTSQQDFLRVAFTWVFFLTLRNLTCCSCEGLFGSIWGLLLLIGKVYVTLPVLKGTEKLYHSLIEENVAKNYINMICNIVKEKTGCCKKEETNQ